MRTNFSESIIKEYEEFFGCPLSKVNRTIQLMVFTDMDKPYWLKSITKWNDLPRVCENTLNYRFNVDHLKYRDIALQAKWIVETLSGAWSLNNKGFCFETIRDASHYKLRWV